MGEHTGYRSDVGQYSVDPVFLDVGEGEEDGTSHLACADQLYSKQRVRAYDAVQTQTLLAGSQHKREE